MSRTWLRRMRAAVGLLPLLSAACIPYSVGTTARPVPAGHDTKTLSIFPMPKLGRLDSTKDFTWPAVDAEWRWGLNERADIGVRIPSGSGVILNSKQLLTHAHSAGAQAALIPGLGFVNGGQHAHFEMTLVVSGPEDTSSADAHAFVPRVVPYGGIRAMQVAPIQEDAVHDQPTVGVFLGTRIGSRDFGFSPEIGVFHDHSALGLRHSSIVVVPSMSIHGDRLIDGIMELIGMAGMFGGRGRRQATVPFQPPPVSEPAPGIVPVIGVPASVPGSLNPHGAAQPRQNCAGPRRKPCRRSATPMGGPPTQISVPHATNSVVAPRGVPLRVRQIRTGEDD